MDVKGKGSSKGTVEGSCNDPGVQQMAEVLVVGSGWTQVVFCRYIEFTHILDVGGEAR